jgi:hypothetical protein
MEFSDIFYSQVLPILLTAFVTVFTYLIKVLSQKVIEFIDEKITNQKFNQAAKIAEETVRSTVLALEQTLVKKIILASADGKLTDNEKARIKKVAMETIITNLQPRVKEALAYGYENVNEYLDALVERLVLTETK